MSDCCPENNGAYRAEMTAIMQDSLEERMAVLRAERDNLQERVDKLEALQGQGCFVQMNNGSNYSIWGYGGDASNGGFMSFLTVAHELPDGRIFTRRYVADDDWVETLQVNRDYYG